MEGYWERESSEKGGEEETIAVSLPTCMELSYAHLWLRHSLRM